MRNFGTDDGMTLGFTFDGVYLAAGSDEGESTHAVDGNHVLD